MKNIKIKIIFLALTLFVGFSIIPESIHAQSCGEVEWNRIKQKYDLDALLFKMQELTNPSSFNQTLYDAYKNHYEQSLIAAKRECAAIGADKADQLRTTIDNSQSTQGEVQRLQERQWQLEDEQRKLLWAEYERALENYNNAAQNTCPPNSSLVGDLCYCNDGYINNGNACVISVSSPTPKPTTFNTQINKSKLRIAESTPTTTPTSTPENKTTTLQEENTPNTETEVERKPQGLIVRIFGAVKNFFSKFFRL